MSMLRKILSDVVALLFPRECAICGEALADGEEGICSKCRFRIPMTGFAEMECNPMIERLSAQVPIEHASALFFFVAESNWRKVIHDFKYHGRWAYARKLGRWFGHILKKSGNYENIDLVVPVPLHLRKRIHRGYNQSDYIADGIASVLGTKVAHHALARLVNNESQTHHQRNERWKNVDGIFRVRGAEQLAGRHILLVDDVFTTGATIISCCDAILAECKDVKISVVTLAVSQKEFGFDRF